MYTDALNTQLLLAGAVLLAGILLSYISIIIFYRLIKSNLSSIYHSEKVFFSKQKTISLKPRTLLDYIAYATLLAVFTLMIWHNFLPTGFTFWDTVLYLGRNACHFKIIPPHAFWGNRFFPFGHQEWSMLAPLLSLTNCTPTIPFLLVTAQYFIVAYLLFCIIPFEKLALRLVALTFIISNASFFTPFVSIVVPDRNSLFLIIAFLYCFINFFKTEKPIYLLLAFICANTALYFKEPIFIYFTMFAFISFCFHLHQKQFKLRDILSPIALIRKQPIEILLPLLSLYFLVLYIVFTAIIVIFPNHPSYDGGAGGVTYKAYMLQQFYGHPLLTLIILMILAYLIDYKNIHKHQFSLMLFSSGLFYAAAIMYFKFPTFYYFAVAEMSIVLAGYYYLQNVTWQKKLKWRAFVFIMASVIMFYTIKSAHNLLTDIQRYQIIKYELNQTKQNFPLKYSDSNKIFYYTTNHISADYNTWLFSILLSNRDSKAEIEFNSFLDFQPIDTRTGLPQQKPTFKLDEWQPDDYDITVFRRQHISDEVWQSLQAQYGERIQKITDFPSWMNDIERYNIYILQR